MAAGGIIVTFPAIIASFTYVYVVLYFCLSIFLACFSAQHVIENPTIKGMICSGTVMILSLSFYQAYIGLTAGILVLKLLCDTIEGKELTQTIRKAFTYLGVLLIGLLGYMGITQGMVHITGRPLKDYQNLQSMGALSLSVIIDGVRDIYRNLYIMITGNSHGLSGALLIKIMTLVCYISIIIVCIRSLCRLIREKKWLHAGALVFLMIIFPISFNLVYLMGSGDIHSVMVYPMIMIYISCIVFADRSADFASVNWKEILKISKIKFVKRFPLYVLLLFCSLQLILVYTHMANVAYLSFELSKNEADSYLTTMITQIKSLDGYRPDMKITFVGKLHDENLMSMNSQLNYLKLTGLSDARSIISMRRKADYLKYYHGVCQEIVHVRDSGVDIDQINELPDYPQQGSIVIMDDVIVVKLSEWHE